MRQENLTKKNAELFKRLPESCHKVSGLVYRPSAPGAVVLLHSCWRRYSSYGFAANSLLLYHEAPPGLTKTAAFLSFRANALE